MTVFAGVFCLGSTHEVPQIIKESIGSHLRQGKKSDGQRHIHDTPGLFLVKWDSGAFAEPAWRVAPNGSVCALAGDPILIEEGRKLTRGQQMARLAPVSAPISDTELARCRGSFALVRYTSDEKTLCLATDAVGLRSIYYIVQDGFLLFATALRVLEAMPEIRKQLSLLGMAELSAFSFPLGERTPYEDLKVLRECEILVANSSSLNLRKYYDWSKPEVSSSDPADAATDIYDRFKEAIRVRVLGDKSVYSFLSGGMDSRAIVATLIGMGRHVEALNFSSNASQDQRYAQLTAADAGSLCRLHCLRGGNYPNFSFLALAAKTDLEQRESDLVDRPQFIWSGDGGSVGLGHVYMDERMLEYGERGDVEGAVKHFFEFNRIKLSLGALTVSARERLPRMLFESVVSEVNRYPREDFGRRIYLFLLFNDQRRHLFKHFETIDQHGLELLTPFYDSSFLKAVAATPARWGLLHRLYGQFFEHLPAFARKAPWQTYPGHLPCPLPRDPSASYQWANTPEPTRDGFVQRYKLARELVGAFNKDMEPQVFSQGRIWLAAALHSLGLRDCKHILPRLQIYQRHHAHTQTGQQTRSKPA